MPQRLNGILKKYVEDICGLYREWLKALILYDSYARGDFKPDSDIDIMILVDLAEQENMKKGRRLSEMTFEYDFDLAFMPIVKNIDHFKKWLRSYPFYI